MTQEPPSREEILQVYADHGATAAASLAGVSKRTAQRWASEAGIVSGYSPPVISPCPSAASYARGCRCDGCIEANRQAQREVKQRRVRRFRKGQTMIEHGTVTAYSNWDCRCNPCRVAWAAYLAERRRANKKS